MWLRIPHYKPFIMKKNTLLFLGFILCLLSSSYGQNTPITFSDSNFKQALLDPLSGVNTNGDGQISINEAKAVTRLNLDGKNISNLDGIEFFENLDILDCSNNNITKIDANHTSTLTKLRFITARDNNIKTIDVRNCKLWGLRLEGNPIEYAYLTGASTFQIEASFGIAFDLANIKYVCISQAQYDPQANNVDHRGFWNLIGSALHIGQCKIAVPNCEIINFPDPNFKQALLNHIPVIDTDGDGEICIDEAQTATSIRASDRNITNASGIEYFKNISYLSLSDNSLSSLDLSSNTRLSEVHLSNNKLVNINLLNIIVLEKLFIGGNMLSQLNLTKNINLKRLSAWGNQLAQINLKENTLLEDVFLNGNLFTQIDITNNKNLISLSIRENNLTSLNTDNNLTLKNLTVSRNKINQLNLTNNVELTRLDIQHNRLTELNTNNNLKIAYLFASYNPFLSSVDISKNGELQRLNLNHTILTHLNITDNNKNLKSIVVKSTRISELDIRKCTSLDYLDASSNGFLKKLYLSGNHSFYQNLSNDLQLQSCSNLNFVCVEPTYFSQSVTYIKNTLGYLNSTVSTNCDETNTTAFNNYFVLGPNPATSFMRLIKKDFIIITDRARILRLSGQVAKIVDLRFSGGISLFRDTSSSLPTDPISLDEVTATIYVNDLNPGYYILSVPTNKGVLTTKFLKQ